MKKSIVRILFSFIIPITVFFLIKSFGWINFDWINFDWVILVDLFLLFSITVIVFIYIWVGTLFYRFKNSRHKNAYGAVEIGVGTLAGLLGIVAVIDDKSVKPFLVYLIVHSSLYVIVRGLESIHKYYLGEIEVWQKKVKSLVENDNKKPLNFGLLPDFPKPKFTFIKFSNEEQIAIAFKNAKESGKPLEDFIKFSDEGEAVIDFKEDVGS
ncbi:hypothetical protein [Peribacillus butanolivorans]|uniref:hypothetical protein n=1 Tax=Peribacillus butanolivorans TaxID=421767 RepID=UPI00366F1471